MADNTTLNAGVGGDVIATDDIAGVKYERVKVNFGADGSATDVSSASPLPVDSELTTADLDTGAGSDPRAVVGLVRAESGGGLLVGSANPLPVNQTAALPAGNNNIGDVDVASLPAIPAGTNNIGDVDVLTLPSIPAGTNNIGDVDVLTLPALPSGTNNIGDVDVLTVPAPLSTTGGGTEATALRVTLANNSTGVVGLSAGTNNIGDVDVLTLPSIPAGNNNIGDVDIASIAAGNNNIGDVDIASIAAGTNNIGNVGVIPRTTGGLTIFHLVSAASTNATNVKASAGQVFGWYISNRHATNWGKVAFHNTAGTPTAGASVVASIDIPPGSAANVFNAMGIAFGTGIGITTVTGAADSDTTAVGANDLNINIYYA